MATVYNNYCNNGGGDNSLSVLMDCLADVEYSGEANRNLIRMILDIN